MPEVEGSSLDKSALVHVYLFQVQEIVKLITRYGHNYSINHTCKQSKYAIAQSKCQIYRLMQWPAWK